MAVFDFNQADQYVEKASGINFLKLEDDGWQAKIRFMYGANEIPQGYTVHKVTTKDNKVKFIPCLRELNQPIDTCPLCKSGNAYQVQFFLPVYVISLTKCIDGVLQAEEQINQPMVFQRGKTFQGAIQSAIRQSKGQPLVNTVFNLVRNGKARSKDTTYSVEYFNTDNTTLENLPPRIDIVGSNIVPNVTYEAMFEYINQPSGIVTRQVQYTSPQQEYGRIPF